MARYDLKAKTALVTGAGSGIGKDEIARALAAKGANVIAAALPAEAGALDELAAELGQNHGVSVWPLTGDLSAPEGPRELYNQVGGITPRLDILVNNAGVISYGFFAETPLEKNELLLNVNIRAYMALMALFVPQMKAAGQGRVLNVCSASAFQPTPPPHRLRGHQGLCADAQRGRAPGTGRHRGQGLHPQPQLCQHAASERRGLSPKAALVFHRRPGRPCLRRPGRYSHY